MTQLLISKALDQYSEQYTSDEMPVLAALNRETNMKIPMPVMLSGHLQGALLQMISHMIKPKNVLEIGTYTGYSAICLAQGLQNGGHLHTIDINEELEDICFHYFCKAGLEGKISQHIGNASEIIPALDATFDLVFIDADKQNYHRYYDLVIDKVPTGGYILADNVLYDGEVVLPEEEQSKNARAIHAFNEKVRQDKRVEHVLLPVRDGIMLMRKIAAD
ncbi:MAG: methyltransferase [Bacteroidetes bacterium 46-16]|nr:MAG: methyltransferase [Bacteroidetes bacterium 46-16]